MFSRIYLFILGLIARFLPSALDRAIAGLTKADQLLERAGAEAQRRLEAERAIRRDLFAQEDASWDRTGEARSDLKRAAHARERIQNLIA